jgi:hypothetical protein
MRLFQTLMVPIRVEGGLCFSLLGVTTSVGLFGLRECPENVT